MFEAVFMGVDMFARLRAQLLGGSVAVASNQSKKIR